MKQLTQYNSKVSNLFFSYLQNGDEREFENRIKNFRKIP